MILATLIAFMPLVWALVVFCGVIIALSAMLLLARKKLVPQGLVKVVVNGDTENPMMVDPGSNLLSALSDQNVFLPSE